MLKTVIHSNRRLVITLFVEEINEQEQAHIEILSTRNGPDLSQDNDVVALIDGRGLPIELIERRKAIAKMGDWEPYATNGFSLMIRVHDYFGGWDFPPQDDDFEPDTHDGEEE